MRFQKGSLGLLILLLALSSVVFAEDHDLPFFLGKASSEEGVLSKNERVELLSRIEKMMEKAQGIRAKLTQGIQAGEVDLRYQEGTFWISKLERDGISIETALQQVKLLKDKPSLLVSSIVLYKSLKDLSENFNAYNNMPSFSAWVGDLAPEMELWTDPVFYQLYLLPLARASDKETESKPPQPAQKEKKPPTKVKKP
ncbi:MAG: hypothetical protein A2162_09235 [Deltaproteobacteria bacterium RBG_13_52_11b]|nr:MAG: hypothetical protein A2162_09235 [Deltaproteobacteria bacterium RBG_13_52_11b]